MSELVRVCALMNPRSPLSAGDNDWKLDGDTLSWELDDGLTPWEFD